MAATIKIVGRHHDSRSDPRDRIETWCGTQHPTRFYAERPPLGRALRVQASIPTHQPATAATALVGAVIPLRRLRAMAGAGVAMAGAAMAGVTTPAAATTGAKRTRIPRPVTIFPSMQCHHYEEAEGGHRPHLEAETAIREAMEVLHQTWDPRGTIGMHRTLIFLQEPHWWVHT